MLMFNWPFLDLDEVTRSLLSQSYSAVDANLTEVGSIYRSFVLMVV